MAIKSTSIHGVYHHRAPTQDKKRPNILLSSDIPAKIALCVAELQLNSSPSRLEDLSKYIKFFDLTLELNSVILRNVNVTISKLLDKNQIFVARSKKSSATSLLSESSFKFPEVWQSVLAMRNRDEIFVVNSRLDIQTFTVDLNPPHEICLIFKENGDFSSLLAYDKDLLDHLKAYIGQRLLAELEHKLGSSISSPSLPLLHQQSPPADLVGMFNDLLLDAHDSIANHSIDGIEHSFEKQMVPMDHDELNYSFEDLRILHSDDSGKCTVDDESELNSPLINTDCLLTTDLVDNIDFNKDVGNEDKQATPTSSNSDTFRLDEDSSSLQPPIEIPTKRKYSAKDEKFVSEIENLRHNFPKFDSDSSLSQNLKTDEDFDINEAPQCDDYVDDIQLSPKKSDVIHSSPQKSFSREPSVLKQSSFSFIDHDDGHGLNYAFKDTSVPEYIKENKKFKFIKIGKVQKFVSMFEENTEPVSNSTSRIGTRPSSPKR